MSSRGERLRFAGLGLTSVGSMYLSLDNLVQEMFTKIGHDAQLTEQVYRIGKETVKGAASGLFPMSFYYALFAALTAGCAAYYYPRESKK